ncbi:MAG: hypothetical protein HQL96_04445 [Magnetococcales bacterium]|nr:hypothetical protein [Magnetococcales bacterium]
MNISIRRKPGASRNFTARIGGRQSVLDHQQIKPRDRNRAPESRMESGRVAVQRPAPTRDNIRHRAEAAGLPLTTRLLEGGVVLAAGLSLFVKNGFGHITGWIREGREMVSGFEGIKRFEWHEHHPDEEYDEEIWDDTDTPPPVSTAHRETKEVSKMHKLDTEEHELPPEELEDQAGALRARFSSASSRH